MKPPASATWRAAASLSSAWRARRAPERPTLLQNAPTSAERSTKSKSLMGGVPGTSSSNGLGGSVSADASIFGEA